MADPMVGRGGGGADTWRTLRWGEGGRGGYMVDPIERGGRGDSHSALIPTPMPSHCCCHGMPTTHLTHTPISLI